MSRISHPAIGHQTKPLKPMPEADGLSPDILEMVRDHFWCDFSDLFPAMKWDKPADQ